MNSSNKISSDDGAIHDWYRFVLSYPPHLVRYYIEKFNIDSSKTVLDPFCGTGTTNIECMKRGISSIGVEANIMTYFASVVKSTPIKDISNFIEKGECIRRKSDLLIKSGQYLTLTDDEKGLLLKGSIDEKILSDVIILKNVINEEGDQNKDHYLLALAKCVVYDFSNLKFSPEVGVSKNKVTAADVPLIWFEQVKKMYGDYNEWKTAYDTKCIICKGDARCLNNLDFENKIDVVITSPPYPNEKDYSRTTRLESVVLGFIHNKEELKTVKKTLLRSNTKNVYKGDDDSKYVLKYDEIVKLSEMVEQRRIELNKNSGFEKMYPKVILNYFGGMAKHLIMLKEKLNHGAKLAYVVGDQASYYKIPIRTAELLSIIAKDVGYNIDGIEIFRTRFATGSGEYLNENVLLLSYEG